MDQSRRYAQTLSQCACPWAGVPRPTQAQKCIDRREQDELGQSLWVYAIGEGTRQPLREVCWVFDEELEWTVQVSAMACRPAMSGDVKGVKELVVEFEDAGVELSESSGNSEPERRATD